MPPFVPIIEAVGQAIGRIAADPNMPMQPKDAAVVAQEVAAEITPVVQHLTNQEPWYKSRVTLGALGSIITAIAAALGFAISPEDMDVIIGVTAAAGTVISSLYTLYGRWRARRPIGT